MLKKLGHPLGCWDVVVDGAERKTTDAFGTWARFNLHFIAASPVRPFPTPAVTRSHWRVRDTDDPSALNVARRS